MSAPLLESSDYYALCRPAVPAVDDGHRKSLRVQTRSFKPSTSRDAERTGDAGVPKWKCYECGHYASGVKQGSLAQSPRRPPRVSVMWQTLMSTILQRIDVFLHPANTSNGCEKGWKARARALCHNAVLGCNTEDAATLSLRRHAEGMLCKLDQAVLMRVSLLSNRLKTSKRLDQQGWWPGVALAAPSPDVAYLKAHLELLEELFAVDFEDLETKGNLKKLVFDLRVELNKERSTMASLQRTYIREVKRTDFLETLLNASNNEHLALLDELRGLKKELMFEKENALQQGKSTEGIEEGARLLIESLRNDKRRLEGQMRNALNTGDIMAASLSSAHIECDRLCILRDYAKCKAHEANMRAEIAEQSLIHDEQHLKELEATLEKLGDARAQIRALATQKVDDERQIIIERQLREQAELRATKFERGFIDAQARANSEREIAESFKAEIVVLRQDLQNAKDALKTRKAVKNIPKMPFNLDRVLREELETVSAHFLGKLAQVSQDAEKTAAQHQEEISRLQCHAHCISEAGGHSKKYKAAPSPAPISKNQLTLEPALHNITHAALSIEAEADAGHDRTAKNWAVRQKILDETEPVEKSKVKWDFRARQSKLPSKDHFENLPCTKPRVLMPKVGKIVDSPVQRTEANLPVHQALAEASMVTS